MKLFKTIDDKIADLGFRKVTDNQFVVLYERQNEGFNQEKHYGYTHVVSIAHKRSGNHIIQSYDAYLFDNQHIGNTCVGLTYKEMKLFLKKMKKKGWHKPEKGDKNGTN